MTEKESVAMADTTDATPEQGGGTPEPVADLGDAGKKALDEERKARRDAERQLKELQTQLKTLEDKDKSEVDKLREELNTLRSTATENELRALRAQVALTKGLTLAQAKRLVGSNLDELEADADEILEAFAAVQPEPKTAPPSRRPESVLAHQPEHMALNGDPLLNALKDKLGIG